VIQSVEDKSGQQVQAIDGKNKPPNDVFNARSHRVSEVVRLGFAIYWAYDAGEKLAVISAGLQVATSCQVLSGRKDLLCVLQNVGPPCRGALFSEAGTRKM
jgi:hypothetical protein